MPVLQTIYLEDQPVDVLRLDLTTPQGMGNKYFKLKHNLARAAADGYHTLLSFGGAFSNHLHALAWLGKEYGFQTIGVVRGEDDPHNPTLQFARKCGMILEFMDRTRYRDKTAPECLLRLQEKYGPFYLLPEGGSNKLAVLGCSEILKGVPATYRHILAACGTGATLAGLAATPGLRAHLYGISVVKGKDTTTSVIRQWLQPYSVKNEWEINMDYHAGGYARINTDISTLIKECRQQFQLPLDPVYTAKVVWACTRLLKEGKIHAGEPVLLIHTGGIQGNAGWDYRFGAAR